MQYVNNSVKTRERGRGLSKGCLCIFWLHFPCKPTTAQKSINYKQNKTKLPKVLSSPKIITSLECKLPKGWDLVTQDHGGHKRQSLSGEDSQI